MSKLSNRIAMSESTEEARPFAGMRRVHPYAAGLDIGAHEVVACVAGSDQTQPVRTFL